MNRIVFAFRFAFAVLLLAAGAQAQPKTLTILHTNDMHASFVPHEAFWMRQTPKPMVGGFKELFFTVDSIRKAVPATLLLDAGDVMTGNPITERIYRHAYGGALIEMMNETGYEAWCPGNHDFDVSQENLAALASIAKFPLVCANLQPEKGLAAIGAVPSLVINRGGLRIGIIGIISQELYALVNQNNLIGLRVLSPDETLQHAADELYPRTDLIIALTHQGFDMDSAMATRVHHVDIIVGGHSHTRLREPRTINGIVIVQAGSNCENLGELTVSIENHHITSTNGRLIQLWPGTNRPANRLTALVDSMAAEIEKEYSEVIGTLGDDWVRRSGPTGVGTFISEAQRAAAGADVGFMNDHGIRKDLSAGPITKKDLFEILPFRNILTTFELSGKQLRDLIRYMIEQKPAIQVTGVSAEWKRELGGGISITRVEVGGSPLEEAKMYKCAASDFFVGDAAHYIGLEIPKPIYLRKTVFEAVEAAVRKAGVIKNFTPFRLTEVH